MREIGRLHPRSVRRFDAGRDRARRTGGAALIVVLAFLVLLAGLFVAFFSRSILDRQISNSSASQLKVEMFSQGVADEIIADVKQEIAAGSTISNPAAGYQVFKPKTAWSATPSRVGTTDSFPNLVKRSASGQAFYAGSETDYDTTAYPPSNRACMASTATASQGGRLISAARWNKPLLMQATSTTDLTPASSYTPPDWILVGRDGSNPTTATTNPAAANYAIGRYAYNIYDEGGLLDMNAAGYPSTMTVAPAVPFFKNSLAYADLKQVGLTIEQVDAIVGWRNYASAKPPGEFPIPAFTVDSARNYHDFLMADERHFLRAGKVPLYNGQSDRIFIGRQQLIKFLLQGVARGDAAQKTLLQNALQYLGTFSRDLSQPSLSPDPARPKIVSGDGGNDAYGGDPVINPSFLSIRAATAFQRNDGSKAVVGEPLVKKRFVLNRLSWLTYKGPSVNRNQSDPDIQALINGGVPWEYLQLGTPTNIQAYFGLTWDAAANGWKYAQPTAGAEIKTLSKVAAENREPDFMELLKATIHVGAIGKGATRHKAVTLGSQTLPASTGEVIWEDYQYRRDVSVDYSIMQIAANIIDQFDCDGYPTVLSFDGGAGAKQFFGVENLPYFYRVRDSMLKAVLPNASPYPAPDTYGPGGTYSELKPKKIGPLTPALTEKMADAGIVASLLQPEIWNPHDPNSSFGNPYPLTLRLIAESRDPDGVATAYDKLSSRSVTTSSNTYHPPIDTSSPPGNTTGSALGSQTDNDKTVSAPFFRNYNYNSTLISVNAIGSAIQMEPDSTEMRFTHVNGTQALFSEPTLLIHPNLPTGSKLGITNGNNLFKVFNDASMAPSARAALQQSEPFGIRCVVDNNLYIGILRGVAPLQWVYKYDGTGPTDPNSGYYIITPRTASVYNNSPSTTTADAFTYRMQYQAPGGTWVTYDQKFTNASGGPVIRWDLPDATNLNDFGLIGNVSFATCIDPRTSRFGAPGGDITLTGNSTPTQYNYSAGSTGFPPDVPAGETYLDAERISLATNRSTASIGRGMTSRMTGTTLAVNGLPAVGGWYPNDWHSSTTPKSFFFGSFSVNDPNATISGSPTQYYADPDGVVRRATGAYRSGLTGLPLVTATSYTSNPAGTPTAQSESRPIILNRPFRSVTDLGYVFSGIPWKNLDMFTPESGFAGLLDVFCIRYTNDQVATEAGKVNLNTRQPLVLQAILTGAYKDELNTGGSTIPGGAISEASEIAAKLVARTSSTAVGKGPLTNLSELVGKWVGSVPAGGGGIDGSKSYEGFSADLDTINWTSNSDRSIERRRESALRALTNSGTTRVWNLMIDLVAQTGRFPANASSLDKFIVEGEQRYWVHVAIDRYTGQVIDKQIEVVKE